MDEYQDFEKLVRFSPRREAIARNLEKSWEVPHFFPHKTVDMEPVIRVREEWFRQTGEKLMYECFFMWAMRECLLKMSTPDEPNSILNSHCVTRDEPQIGSKEGKTDKRYLYKHHEEINVSIAVNIEPKPGKYDLVMPVFRNVEKKSFREVRQTLRPFIERVQAEKGKSDPEFFRSGTITLNNFGALGSEYGTPILNPPQSTNVGFSSIEYQPDIKFGDDGPYYAPPRRKCKIVLGCDHRVYDAIPQAAFLQNMKTYLENFPLNILIL